MKTWIFISLTVLTLTSCFKEEMPVPKKDRGDIVTETLEMGPTYDTRFYINLDKQEINGSINKYDWDIALSGDSLNPYIRLNTSIGMYAYKTGKQSIAEVLDTNGLMSSPLIDYPAGDKDSLALSGILESGEVYLIDLGIDAGLQKSGYLLLKANLNLGHYALQYKYFNQSRILDAKVDFNPGKSHLLYSFKTGIVTMEPDKKEWDFMITQYQHVYYAPFQTYSVVGCLINPSKVSASIYKGNKTFSELNLTDAMNADYSKREDHIGFGWKYYDLNKNKYIIRPEKCYFIKYDNGVTFKLHFIGFYNDKGEKGTPIFEYKEL